MAAKSSSTAGAGCLILFSLPFAGVGVAMLFVGARMGGLRVARGR